MEQTCDICGSFSANDSSTGIDPYAINIMSIVKLCSICFKKLLLDFTAVAKAYIETKKREKCSTKATKDGEL